MGIITEISQQKNKKRVNIFVDSEFKSGLGVETAIKFGLKTGKEINDKELEQIIIESETHSAFETALKFLSTTPKTKYEIKQKLFKKGFIKDVVENALMKLEEYHYIDDESYVKMYIDSVSKKSKTEIQRNLRAKGIEKEIIDTALLEFDELSEEQNAFDYATKYMKNKIVDTKSLRNLMLNLMRKGYSYEISLKMMQKFQSGEDLW